MKPVALYSNGNTSFEITNQMHQIIKRDNMLQITHYTHMMKGYGQYHILLSKTNLEFTFHIVIMYFRPSTADTLN